jgi:hypothetical protein
MVAAYIPLFATSATIYPLNGVTNQRQYEDAGIRLNATYNIALRDDEKDFASSIMRMRLRSHICDVTGGTVEYKIDIASGTISLHSGRSEDRVLKDL